MPSRPTRSAAPPRPGPSRRSASASSSSSAEGIRSEPSTAARALPRVLEAVEARDHEPVDVGARAQLEGGLHHDAERAEGADVELREIVARHVLDHLAPAPYRAAVGADHGEADHQVARRAVEVPARPRGVAGEDAAERRAVGRGRIERQPLAPLAQLGLQPVERDARPRR